MLASVGALSFGIAVGLDVVAAQQLLPEGRLTCAPGMSNCPRPLDEAVRAYNAYSNGGLACFVVGGAAFVGMVTYVIWPGPKAKPSSPQKANTVRVEVLPLAGPGFGGLGGSAHF